jgi:positive regulator of sigma E activity
MAAKSVSGTESKQSPRTPASGEVLGRALNVGVSGFAFGFLGHWIGTKVGAPDVLAVFGAFVGASAGFYSLYAHATGRLEQDRSSDSS